MRICIVAPGYPGQVNPVNGVLVREETSNLSRLGCDIAVVTARVFKKDPKFTQDGPVKIYRFLFPSQHKLLAEYETIPFIRVCFYVASGILKILRVALAERSELIHAHWAIPAGFMAVIAGKIMRKPVVITVHDADIMTFPKKSRIAAGCIRFALRHADKIISVNNVLKDTVGTFGVINGKVQLIPLGIDQPLFSRLRKEEARRRLHLPADKSVVLFVGALLEIKGIRQLVEAIPEVLTEHANVLFALVGNGPLEDEVRTDIDRHGVADAVKLAGQRPHNEIPVWMSAADILVVPSLSEGRPRAGLEALSVGLPVIASKVGAITEVIEDGRNGLLVEPGSASVLAQALNRLLGDAGLLACLTEGAEHEPAHDARVAAEQIKKVYIGLLGL